jgi:MFS family permease
MLFCGGMMLPGIMGMMLNTVDENLKTMANSIANTSFNSFGFLPSPYIYGLISDYGDVIGGNKRNAMKVNMFLPTVFSMLIVWQAIEVKRKEF